MSEETFGDAPEGMLQDDWEKAVTDECFKIAEHNAIFRHSTGANEALRQAKEIVRGRYESKTSSDDA